jgi:hypothetical protein
MVMAVFSGRYGPSSREDPKAALASMSLWRTVPKKGNVLIFEQLAA